MSYSYITKVFPDFKYSNVYDSKIYSNISGLNSHGDIKDITFTATKEPGEFKEINKKNVETNFNLETYKNIGGYNPNKLDQNGPFSNNTTHVSQNNEKYYNTPLPANLINENNNIINKSVVLTNKTGLQELNFNQIPTTNKELDLHKETFSNDNDHDSYIKHILKCEQCKDVLIKQFNIESDRIRNEEILELISFLIFGLFILLLLDKIK